MRIDAEAAALTPELVALRKEAIESEFQRQAAGLLTRVVRERWGSILDVFAVAALALVAALILQQAVLQSTAGAALLAQALTQPAAVYALWATAGVAVAGALCIGLRTELRSVVHWV